MSEKPSRWPRKWINILFLLPFLAALCVPVYNFDEPRLLGVPFFYAWQILWIWLGAAVTWIVYAIGWKGSDQ